MQEPLSGQCRALERRTVPDGLWVGYGYELVAVNMPYRPNCQQSAVTGPSGARPLSAMLCHDTFCTLPLGSNARASFYALSCTGAAHGSRRSKGWIWIPAWCVHDNRHYISVCSFVRELSRLLAIFLAGLPIRLPACLPAWLAAGLPACLPACLFARSLARTLASFKRRHACQSGGWRSVSSMPNLPPLFTWLFFPPKNTKYS